MRKFMATVTKVRFIGVGTGALITVLLQSSSATTVMVVGFVNSRLMNLGEAIVVIFGANLGTTATFWMVSFLGIKFSVSHIALPIIGVALPMIFWKGERVRCIGESLIGFGILFLGLSFLRDSIPDIQSNPELFAGLQSLTAYGYLSVLIFLFLGIILTIVVQSSSVAGAITLMMASKGWIDFEMSCAIILGENIGTTITANLAAIGGSTNAKRAAFAHFMFNVIGVLWMLVVFYPFVWLIDSLMPGEAAAPEHIAIHLALFHTLFNFTNILLQIYTVERLQRFITKVIPEPKEKIGTTSLEFISIRDFSTAQLDLEGARHELRNLVSRTIELFKVFVDLYQNMDQPMDDKVQAARIKKERLDNVAKDLSDYLLRCSSGDIDQRNVAEIALMTLITGELQAINDWNEKLHNFARLRQGDQMMLLSPMAGQVSVFAKEILKVLETCRLKIYAGEGLPDATEREGLNKEISDLIREHKDLSLSSMRLSISLKAELLYQNIFSSFEKIAHHCLNIFDDLAQQTALTKEAERKRLPQVDNEE
jgi:phosphate:Na+ symporter